MPCLWRWTIEVRLPGVALPPTGSAKDRETAMAEFKAAWDALKAGATREQLAAAYQAMNERDEN